MMGTRGYMAYRYKGKYYREYISDSAYPFGYGVDILRSIPRNPAVLKKWIAEKASRCSARESEPDDEVYTDASWTLGDTWIQWTYVIDLDNQVLTVNGVLHFKFSHLPPALTKGSKLGFVDYLRKDEQPPWPEIPERYLTSIDLWPELKFEAEKAQQVYTALQPTVVALSEWNAPTWDTLSVSQHLSVSLIKTLVYDHSDELALCYFPSTWMKLGVFCWDVANAAATSHLLCPPESTSPKSDMIYVFDINLPEKDEFLSKLNAHYYLQHKRTMCRYDWFRGCLFTFFPRLDDPAYMTLKVAQMVQRLRKKRSDTRSGSHYVGVACRRRHGQWIRSSPFAGTRTARWKGAKRRCTAADASLESYLYPLKSALARVALLPPV
ncbi:CHD5 domain protein, putative, partial [Rhizoctonia solani AG-3 Rhs1AP]